MTTEGTIGVELSDDDLEALRTLYRLRWTATIHTWKERDTDFCLWFVTCPNAQGEFLIQSGHNLADTIDKLLKKAIPLQYGAT